MILTDGRQGERAKDRESERWKVNLLNNLVARFLRWRYVPVGVQRSGRCMRRLQRAIKFMLIQQSRRYLNFTGVGPA